MARCRVRAAGSGGPDEVWDRYSRPSRWAEWAPQVRGVDTDVDHVVPGAAGRVHVPGGVVVRFVVVDVDPARRQWSWVVNVGPARLYLEHSVHTSTGGGCVAEAIVEGPWPLVRMYRVPMWVALRRLVRSGSAAPPRRSVRHWRPPGWPA